MNFKQLHIGKLFLFTSLVMLLSGLVFGVLASLNYVLPGHLKETFGFIALRPLHVSSILFWILLGASGSVFSGLELVAKKKPNQTLAVFQWLLWIIAVTGVTRSYFLNQFGGREYWEFSPEWALPIAVAWLLFLINFFITIWRVRKWPVYIWMWMTGIVFFLFTFIENYLWIIPYFREHFVTDMTIQWKVNGSMVGAWNQMIYGTAIFLMTRISKSDQPARSRLAFFMYFLGLFNLMFNWGHHIYTLPTEAYVRYLGYGVSMTEWIIFIRIIYTWKASVTEAQKHYHYFPYRFLMAADLWVFLNIGQALLMSIPAINIYTHGTHVTVAHAMGTTIGINTMILCAVCFEFLDGKCGLLQQQTKRLNYLFWTAQVSLLVFWLSLNIVGILKGMWQMSDPQIPFAQMMASLRPWFIVFIVAGGFLMLSIGALAVALIRSYLLCQFRFRKFSINKSLFTNIHLSKYT